MLFYHLTMVGIRWGEPIWRFEFLPLHMTNHSTKLQSTHLVHTKCYLLMLGLIIHGKESVTFATMDMYLEPLIEELQMSWKGVKVFDSL